MKTCGRIHIHKIGRQMTQYRTTENPEHPESCNFEVQVFVLGLAGGEITFADSQHITYLRLSLLAFGT